MNAIFLSTLPARGATVYRHVGLAVKVLFLSTLPARGATVFQRGCINVKCQFLSTLPARGATDGRTGAVVVLAISIHAPREGSDRIDAPALQLLLISIHAPREGSGPAAADTTTHSALFLSTLPARGSDQAICMAEQPTFEISIHAPREGSDAWTPRCGWSAPHFYPRSPRGERPPGAFFFGASDSISIHAPARGATARRDAGHLRRSISIHAPREGSDVQEIKDFSNPQNFYPRSPRGERPAREEGKDPAGQDFYPRSPRGERRIADAWRRM